MFLLKHEFNVINRRDEDANILLYYTSPLTIRYPYSKSNHVYMDISLANVV